MSITRKLLIITLSVSIYLVFLLSLWLQKSYPCIDSMVVQKFNVITHGRNLAVYECKLRKKADYSSQINDYIQSFNSRINRVALVLEKYAVFSHKINLEIDENNPLAFAVTQTSIRLGSALLEAEGHLERALIKAWILQLHEDAEAQEKTIKNLFKANLFDESFADLIQYAIFGDLNLVDPVSKLNAKLNSAKWPQVLQNMEAYCDSSWKTSEDMQPCSNLNQNINDDDLNDAVKRKQIIALSLRPLLTSALVASFQQLSFYQQNLFLNELPGIIKAQSINSAMAMEYLLSQEQPLKEGLSLIKIFSDQLSLKDKSDLSYYRKYVLNFNYYLQNHGVIDSFAEAYFDILIEFPEHLDTSSNFFKSVNQAAQKNLNLQIAIKDDQQIWILPSKSGLDSNIFDKIKARQHVFFACPILKTVNIIDFIKTSEKLLLIKECDNRKQYAFDTLFKRGVRDFIVQHNKLTFIQFHLPSLEQKVHDFENVKNFFELVQNRDIARPEFKVLGWQDLQWNQTYQYYQPKAIIDAIEYFRVDTPQTQN